MVRVGVLGAAGRVGIEVCRAVAASDDLELVAAVDPAAAGRPLAEVVGGDSRLTIASEREALLAAGVTVAVDFTVASAAIANLTWCAAHGVHAVSGTTGISHEALNGLEELFASADAPNAVIAANFAITAVLLLRLAELCAPHLDGVEIIELHHDKKNDAPSGTALETARRIAGARESAGAGRFSADPTRDERLPGSRGASGPGAIRIHAVRLPGLVAHQEVIFGATGQSLTLRQDSYERSSYMPGVLLAVRAVASTPGLTVGLEPLLGM